MSALALAVVGLVAWALLGTVERSLTSECVLTLAGERYRIESDATGRVIEVFAKEGDPVEAGQPLARVQLHELDHEVSVAQARVALIARHLEAGDSTFLSVLSTARAELLDLEARRESGGLIVSPYSGEITALDLVPEQEVTEETVVATVRTPTERRFQAITLVSAEDAQTLEAGMQSRVILPARAQGDEAVLEAEVAQISDRPVSPDDWLRSTGLEASPAEGTHLLALALTEPVPATVSDGNSCHLRVVLSRDPPIRLLRPPSGAS